MNEYLDHTFTVSSYEMDTWGYLKPTAILNICQEAAYMHSTLLGFGYEALINSNLAWVLSRAAVEVLRLPVWGEQVRVRTWHKRQSGLFGLRDYIFYDAQDEPIIRVTTSWIIINLSTRRLTRIDRALQGEKALNIVSYNCDAIEGEAEKIETSAEKIILGEHRVVYSDMDVNEHVNNVKYLEWACDNSQQQMDSGLYLSRFCINFNHESKFGDSVSLSRSSLSPLAVIIEGEIEARNIFIAKLEYSFRN